MALRFRDGGVAVLPCPAQCSWGPWMRRTNEGQETLRGEGSRALSPRRDGTESRAASSPPGPRHRAEQRDGAAHMPAQTWPGPDSHLPGCRAHAPTGARRARGPQLAHNTRTTPPGVTPGRAAPRNALENWRSVETEVSHLLGDPQRVRDKETRGSKTAQNGSIR